MITDPCDHIWKSLEGSTNDGRGIMPSRFRCEKCKIVMIASEVFQLEALKGQEEVMKALRGWQKWTGIGSLIVAGLALLTTFVIHGH